MFLYVPLLSPLHSEIPMPVVSVHNPTSGRLKGPVGLAEFSRLVPKIWTTRRVFVDFDQNTLKSCTAGVCVDIAKGHTNDTNDANESQKKKHREVEHERLTRPFSAKRIIWILSRN